jgi:hypothetical protein
MVVAGFYLGRQRVFIVEQAQIAAHPLGDRPTVSRKFC